MNRKKFALFLGYSLAALLILAFLAAIAVVIGFFGGTPSSLQDFSIPDGKVDTLVIDDFQGKLFLRTGSRWQVEGKNAEDIQCALKDGVLSIEGDKRSILSFFRHRVPHVTLTIPEDCRLKETRISIGAGTLVGSGLQTETLFLEGGAGDLTLDQLLVTQQSNIKGGVGDISLSGSLSNLSLKAGVGDIDCDADFPGSSSLKAGLGDLDLHIPSPRAAYSLKLHRGLGEIEVDDQELSSGLYESPDASSFLSIDAGLGDISLDFAQ